MPADDPFTSDPGFVDLKDLAPRALAAAHNVLDYVDSLQVHEPGSWFPLLNPDKNDIGPARWAIFLRLSVSLLQPPTKLPRWLEHLDSYDSYRLAAICEPSKSAPALRSLLALLCRRLERPDFDLSTSVSRLQQFLGVYFDELHVPDSFEAGRPTQWSNVLNRESLGPTITWLTQQLKSDIATPAVGSSNDRSRETAWGDAVSLVVKLVAVAEDISNFFNIRGVALKSSKVLRQFWISCFNYRLHESWDLVPLGGLDAEALSNIKTAIAAFASDPPPEIDREKALNLCDDLCWSLRNDRGDVRASNLVPAWRVVFDALTQLLQRTQVEDLDAATDLSNWCFLFIKDVDGIDNLDDDAKYTAWLATFNSEDSPVPDEFIEELLRINPNPQDPLPWGERSPLRLWRIRRPQSLSVNAQTQARETTIADTPDALLVTSNVGTDNPGSRSPPGSSALENERAPDDTDTRDLSKEMETSKGPQEDGSEAPVPSIVHDITTQSTPNVASHDPQGSLSYVDIHADALDTASTDNHNWEEARAVSTHAEDDSIEDNAITQPEGLPMPAVVIASVASPREPVADMRQAQATHGDTTDGDQQRTEARPALAPDATTSNVPSPHASFVTPVTSSQDIQPDHGDGVTTSGKLRVSR
ncbi:hypothetical protein BDW22DRAFT_1433083 [Trametopsis cervina]|nr:hypothetical protein BDW22DRAFT_1433083 [Trametopsis cervina]